MKGYNSETEFQKVRIMQKYSENGSKYIALDCWDFKFSLTNPDKWKVSDFNSLVLKRKTSTGIRKLLFMLKILENLF